MIAPRYIKKGRRGGQEAADELSLHISNYLIEEYGESSSSVELAFMCLLDKNNYANTIESFGLPTTADRLGEFITGFNHAGGDFLMADVGPASSHEATQKLKGTSFDLCDFVVLTIFILRDRQTLAMRQISRCLEDLPHSYVDHHRSRAVLILVLYSWS